MKKILLNQLDCTIVVSPGSVGSLLTHVQENIRKEYSGVVVILAESIFALPYTSTVLEQLAAFSVPCHRIVIPDGEQAKTLAVAESCWNKMLDFKLDKNTLVVALGGGTVIDLVGYVASCYMRGVEFISIPTTLTGMVDAAITGRNSVNLSNVTGRGSIGTVHYPKLVLIDSQFLNSLPFHHLQHGLTQAIKYAVAHDIELFAFLEKSAKEILKGKLTSLNQIIEHACNIKADIIRRSLRQQDVEDTLHWGCTLGNALHTATGYRMHEGATTAIGMCCEVYLSQSMGLVDQAFVDRHEALCTAYQLPTTLPEGIAFDDLLPLIPTVKQTSDKHTFVLPHKIGKVFKHEDVNREIIAKTVLTKSIGARQNLKR